MTSYDKTVQFYANQKIAKLRELLRRDYGARKYRISADGNVHVFGKMPNSIETGWYLLSSVTYAMSEYNI